MGEVAQCLKAFLQCLVLSGAITMAAMAGFAMSNYSRELEMYNSKTDARGTFTPVHGGCLRRLASSRVRDDCYSCNSQCGRASCYCETINSYNVSVLNPTSALLSGWAYESEFIDGPRNERGTCTVDVPNNATEIVACWTSSDPSRAAEEYACGSPACMKLEDPNLIRGKPEDERWLYVGIAAALLFLSVLIVGPCCCSGAFERCGLTCMLDDESDDSVQA